MQFKALSFASLLATAGAQSLTDVLAGNADLSQLAALIKAQPALASSLSGASNITVLAPSNNAISALLNSSAGAGLSSNPDLVAAVLSYHVLNGTYLASAVPENETFIPTLLNNPLYSNVTGGQRVGAVRSGNNVTFFSGGLANSSVTTAVCLFSRGSVNP